ncbi:hypothetical protein HCN44_002351 [Aphidius gifuensis]|uniref:Uncharacterized protein n=1 Tax=Aphidius gifuensis TaxID=684658 RepID=A0A834XZU7_APHGI|nr:uncharacterized protein LOC122860749 [Aphidius gifuensis]KAF7996705.1 hypothetical protein HCN44_002351 [Aphidius gifuensis]
MGNTTARDNNKEEDQEAILNTPKKSKTYWKYKCTFYMFLVILKCWVLYSVSQRSSNVPTFTIHDDDLRRSNEAYQNIYTNYAQYTARNKEMLNFIDEKLYDNSKIGSLGSTNENLLMKKLSSLNDGDDNK